MAQLRRETARFGKVAGGRKRGKEADSPRNVTLYSAVPHLKGNA